MSRSLIQLGGLRGKLLLSNPEFKYFSNTATSKFLSTFQPPLIPSLSSLSRDPWTEQRREMSRIKTRHTHPRFTWAKKRRERHDQELTKENQEFLGQAILDKFGPAYQEESSGMPWMSPLKEVIRERGEWTPMAIRTGVIARKIGIYPLWDTKGNRMLTTLLQVVDNHVIKYISPEVVQKNYGTRFRGNVGLLLVGAQSTDPQVFTKEYCGLFQEAGLLPKVKINRFLITPDAYLQPGTPLYATHFEVGQHIDVTGHTIDRGFQGVMKRWGFKGMPATHGVTKSHRRGGNIGGGGEKGRVWPGTKMPGHMGNQWRNLRAQEIVRIIPKYNVIYIKGPSCPGEVGSFVTLRDTLIFDKKLKSAPHFPTHYPEESQEPIADEYWSDSVHKFADPSILFEENR